MRPTISMTCILLATVAACSSTPSDPASFEELYLGFNDIDAAINSLPPPDPADLAAATGTATYEGFAYVRHYENDFPGGLRFMAVGEAVVDADLDTLAISGAADTFYEIDVAQSDLNSTDPNDYATAPITGTLSSASTADGWQGTLTPTTGSPIAFDMDVYNTAFHGSDVHILLIEADGSTDPNTTNPSSFDTFEFMGYDENRAPLVQ